MTDDLRQRYAQAMAEAAGSHAFRNKDRVWEHMRAAWYRNADAALAIRDDDLQELRNQIAIDTEVMEKADRDTDDIVTAGRAFRTQAEQAQVWGQQNSDRANRYRARLLATEAALERVRAVHERRESDSGSPYCNLCANHGDISWPCATIAVLDTPPTKETS